jgi:large subunit ribosomal protein L31
LKKEIHPEYKPTRFICACGSVIETRSTRGGEVKIDICSSCHPFFTGRQKLVDSAGKVERFQKRYEGKPAPSKTKAKPKAKPKLKAKPGPRLKTAKPKTAKSPSTKSKSKSKPAKST